MDKKTLQIYCTITLILAAIISGLSFVAQKDGMNFVKPFTFNTLRAFIGSFSLLITIYFFKLFSKGNIKKISKKGHLKLLKAGIICGIILFIALSINQICMIYSPAGKAGFMTSLYIIFVPLISVFLKKKLQKNVLYGVILALFGLYFLCFKSQTGVEISDLFLLISAIFFGIHIVVVSHFAKKTNPLKLSCIQFLVVGILSLPVALIVEAPEISNILEGILPILFTGIVVTAGAYTLQIFGQKATKPTTASLILSSEAVFAALGGIILLNETLTAKEILGCILMLAAIVVTQINFKNKKKIAGDTI